MPPPATATTFTTDASQWRKAISAAWVANSVVLTLPEMVSVEDALRMLRTASKEITISMIIAMISTTPRCRFGKRVHGTIAFGAAHRAGKLGVVMAIGI